MECQRRIKVLFSNHAREMIAKRNLSRDNIIKSLIEPDEILLDARTNHLIAIRKLDITALVVIYDITNSTYGFVTAFRASKLSKLIESRTEKGC